MSLIRSSVVFLASFLVFWVSPVMQMADSRYSLLLSHRMLHHAGFALESYFPEAPPLEESRLVERDGHLYYTYLPGSSILSLPLLAAAELLGRSVVDAEGHYVAAAEERLQQRMSCVLMALLVVLLERSARLLVSPRASLALALAVAFGSPVWSTATRAMWSHTWAMLLLGLCVSHLLSRGVRGCAPDARRLGLLLAWACWVRPTSALSVVGVGVYLWRMHRPLFEDYARTVVGWLLPLPVYAWICFGQLTPLPQPVSSFGVSSLVAGAWGVLLSPGRGLFVYSPILGWLAWRLIREWRRLPERELAALAGGVVLAHGLMLSAWAMWWGGHSYGPRLFSCMVPWLALLGAQAVAARPLERAERGWVGLLLGLSVLLHGLGALCLGTWTWNAKLTPFDPGRLNDWRRAPFWAAVHWPFERDLSVMPLGKKVFLSRSHVNAYLGSGWSEAQGLARWTVAASAELVFRAPEPRPVRLLVKIQPFLVRKRLLEQCVILKLNGQVLGDVLLTEATADVWELAIPASAWKPDNTLTFELPDATPPDSVLAAPDPRPWGAGVWWLQLD